VMEVLTGARPWLGESEYERTQDTPDTLGSGISAF